MGRDPFLFINRRFTVATPDFKLSPVLIEHSGMSVHGMRQRDSPVARPRCDWRLPVSPLFPAIDFKLHFFVDIASARASQPVSVRGISEVSCRPGQFQLELA